MRNPIVIAAIAALFLVFAAHTTASAQATGATINGRILETSAGLPVGKAEVRLLRAGAVVETTTTASDGTFSFKSVAPGDYTMLISARGYVTVRTQPLPVAAGQAEVGFQTALTPATAGLREIAQVAVASHAALQTSATINKNISPNLIQDQNFIRAGDALATLPFVTASTSSSLGDDESLSLRGFDPTEGQALLDGHPIGPQGAHGSGYDYQLAQFWGFSNISVIYGSGATGLYGFPTIAGAVDFDTINPTPQTHVTVTQGIGDLGHQLTGIQITGSANRLGYAAAYGVQGTDGELNQNILQTGLLGSGYSRCPNDPTAKLPVYNGPNAAPLPPTLTGGDLQACNYLVSGAYLNRNIVGKLTYQFDPKTAVAVTVYNAGMSAESTGNGDTDFITYPYELQVAKNLISAGGNNMLTLPNGSTGTCPTNQLPALNDSAAGFTCLSATQYAKDFSGPMGGGLGRFHSGVLQDYHTRITRQIGAGTLTLDGFIDNYGFVNVKGPPPAAAHDDTYFTHGALISDEYAGSKNDFSFGVYFNHQLHETNGNNPVILGGPFVGYTITDTVYFLHDLYSPSQHFSVFADLGLDRSLNTSTTNVDPRLSLVFRPTSNDVFRITGGRSTSEPDPSLLVGGFVFDPPVNVNNSFNPQQSCQPLVGLGSGVSPFVKPEQANDVEAAVAHRFDNQATVEVDAYDTTETNPILGATFPLSVVPASQIPSQSYFQGYINALQTACGRTYTLSSFGVSAPFNAGHATYRGFNVETGIPITRQFELDAGYTIQSAYYDGMNREVLINNSSLINGSQIYGVPLHQANVGIGFNNRISQWTARIDEYYVGAPNGFNRPAYWFANASASKTVGPITFNLGINNLFNNDASEFGLIGLGTPVPQNQFSSGNSTAFEQGAEEYALPYRQIWLTTTFHF
jgi:hypothetical protein